jgi:hypothetical protein
VLLQRHDGKGIAEKHQRLLLQLEFQDVTQSTDCCLQLLLLLWKNAIACQSIAAAAAWEAELLRTDSELMD